MPCTPSGIASVGGRTWEGKGVLGHIDARQIPRRGPSVCSLHLEVSGSAAERVNAFWQEASLATSAGNNALETKP